MQSSRLRCHPAIVAALALGSLRDRTDVIAFLAAQRSAIVARHDEVMTMIDHRGVFSMGIVYTDAHLLASVILDQREAFWTRDKRLQGATEKVGAVLCIAANLPDSILKLSASRVWKCLRPVGKEGIEPQTRKFQ